MNIASVIEQINKENNCDIKPTYYTYIKKWTDWWRGFYKPFHQYYELNGNKKVKRKLYTLKMAKKVCEDWASILMNEKTQITVDDEQSNEFVINILNSNNFEHEANALIEKAFATGTGAFVVKTDNMIMTDDNVILQSEDSTIRIEYLPAYNIIPITIKHGKIIDIAFVSEILDKGKKNIYVETHFLKNNGYEITNKYYKEEEGELKEEPLPEGILPSYSTGTNVPMFSVFSPNIVNNVDDTAGLGISVFANALDVLCGVDLAYNNFNRDFKLGGKKVFYNKSLIIRDENGNSITPDDIAQQLFTQLGDGDLDDTKQLIQEFNPTLRVNENVEGIQAQLDYLSFKCGFGAKYYQFNNGTIVTATQYMGDRQDMIDSINKHCIAVKQALQNIVRAILWIGHNVVGANVNADANILVMFDDSYIIDKEAERDRDRQDVSMGVMSLVEYRAKWYGETTKEAEKKLPEQANIIE